MRLAHRAPRRPAKRPWKSWRGAEVQQRALNSGSSAPIHSTAHVVGCPATSSCHQASRPGTNGTSARLAARAWSNTSTVGTSWPPAVTFLSASSTMPCAGLSLSRHSQTLCAPHGRPQCPSCAHRPRCAAQDDNQGGHAATDATTRSGCVRLRREPSCRLAAPVPRARCRTGPRSAERAPHREGHTTLRAPSARWAWRRA